MTDQERRDAFVNVLNQLSEQYGFALEVGLAKEELGSALLVKPIITIIPVQGWQPSDQESAVEHANGSRSKSKV